MATVKRRHEVEAVREHGVDQPANPLRCDGLDTGIEHYTCSSVEALRSGQDAAQRAGLSRQSVVRQLEPIRCASALFSGPIAQIGVAYSQIFPSIIQQGLTPSDEVREMHLYWEGAESRNNVVMIQAVLN